MTKRIRILAISGSLRAQSSNTELLRAAALIAGKDVELVLYRGLAGLPHFNPDLDSEGADIPPSVKQLRAEIEAAHAVVISSPEYAHGVPGSLKNGLDWLVSGPEMVGKRIGLLNASARSIHAHASLEETLRTMSARMVEGAVVTVPLGGRRLEAIAIAADLELAAMIRRAICALLDDLNE